MRWRLLGLLLCLPALGGPIPFECTVVEAVATTQGESQDSGPAENCDDGCGCPCCPMPSLPGSPPEIRSQPVIAVLPEPPLPFRNPLHQSEFIDPPFHPPRRA